MCCPFLLFRCLILFRQLLDEQVEHALTGNPDEYTCCGNQGNTEATSCNRPGEIQVPSFFKKGRILLPYIVQNRLHGQATAN